MKNLFLSALIALPFVFLTSCGNDDDGPVPPTAEELIVGTWNLSAKKINGVSVYDADDCSDQETLMFGDNDGYAFTNYEDAANGGCQEAGTANGSYSIDANQLKLVISGVSSSKEFTVSETELVTTETYSNGGTDFTAVSTYTKKN